MDNKNQIRIIFTPKADSALSAIIKKYNLDEYVAIVKLDFLAKSFAIGKISLKGMSDYLEKELGIFTQTAILISKDITDNVVPFLVKAQEEKFNDPKFVEEISKQVFDEEKDQTTTEQKKDSAIVEPIIKKELKNKINPPPKKQAKKNIATEENNNSTQKPQQRIGPDSYREPIE